MVLGGASVEPAVSIVGLGGSLRKGSTSLAALQITLEAAARAGASTRLFAVGDHDPPYLTDQVVGLITTAGGTQGLQAINTMEFIVRALRGWAVPLVSPVAQARRAFDGAGRVRDDMVGGQLATLGAEVVRAARQMAAQGRCDYSEPWE
jgi:NAD(P)H-dependent FMN reductase